MHSLAFNLQIPLDIQPPAEMDDRYWYQPYYQVHVKGEGQDVYFKHSTQVQFEQKAFSTFIQTDKGMYKPGQKGETVNCTRHDVLGIILSPDSDVHVYL